MSHQEEVQSGKRFEFGDNWNKYLKSIDEQRIRLAEKSLREMLGEDNMEEKLFLDIGSGSGIFSLAARNMGAIVHSFDYDPISVRCTNELRSKYYPNDTKWTIEEGSVLDKGYLAGLGDYDIVYSWGVLHHTGKMWEALDNIKEMTKHGGKLFIAIYNDQGRHSKYWLIVKRIYNQLPTYMKSLIIVPSFVRLWGPTFIKDTIAGKPLHSWRKYEVENIRGMSPWYDVIDWVGGYPFEVARPDEIFSFYRKNDYQLEKMNTCACGHGCNEYVFIRK